MTLHRPSNPLDRLLKRANRSMVVLLFLLPVSAALTGCGSSFTASRVSGNQIESLGDAVTPSAMAQRLAAATTPLWTNENFQPSKITVAFDAVPSLSAANGEDAVIGLSNGVATGYSSLAAIVRFSSNGIDARNGGEYQADANVQYQAGANYHIVMDVNIVAHTYSVSVTPPGGAAVVLAKNYAFRTEQASVPTLNDFAYYSDAGSVNISNILVTLALANLSGGSATPPSAPVPAPAPAPAPVPVPRPTVAPTPVPPAITPVPTRAPTPPAPPAPVPVATPVPSVPSPPISGAFPGQSGNPVGFAAFGALGTTPWPGGAFVSGTAANPTVYKGYRFTGPQTVSGSYIEFTSCDFNSGTAGVNVTGSHITFKGNRFQSNSSNNYNVQTSGTYVTFSYNSFTPLAMYYTSPPGAAWPSAGAGKNTTQQVANVNSIDGSKGYQYGLAINSGGPLTIDHNDFWGFGNDGPQFLGTTAQINITDNWIHDAANASPQGYHIDGIGYVNGAAGPSNLLIQHNTVASIGNTNGLAFQAATSGYNNIQIIGNYMSGFGYLVALGTSGKQQLSNSSFVNNVFGTDLQYIFGPIYADYSAVFRASGNRWSGNTLRFSPGTAAAGTSGFKYDAGSNGLYLWPNSSLHPTDF